MPVEVEGGARMERKNGRRRGEAEKLTGTNGMSAVGEWRVQVSAGLSSGGVRRMR